MMSQKKLVSDKAVLMDKIFFAIWITFKAISLPRIAENKIKS